jgi:glutathione S-transferase
MSSELVLFADSSWQSPWVFHVMVALEELRAEYRLEPLALPIAADRRAELQRHAVLGKVPCVADGELWLTESSAISEYLAEKYAPPQHPRIMPAALAHRARARQVMSWLRTSLFALREERPTSSVFQRPVTKPLSDKAKADAAELVRVTEQLLAPGASALFGAWTIADADLALALMRLVANSDTVPQRIVDYALAQWSRASIRKFLAYIPTTS